MRGSTALHSTNHLRPLISGNRPDLVLARGNNSVLTASTARSYLALYSRTDHALHTAAGLNLDMAGLYMNMAGLNLDMAGMKIVI